MHPAAFFDLDKTLVALSTEQRLVMKLHQRGLVGGRQLARVLLATLGYRRLSQAGYAAMKKRIVKDLLQGKSRDAVAEAAAEAFRETLAPALHPEALQAIERHKSEGCRVYLVTATVDAVAGLFAEHVGAAGYEATCLEERDGMFTGNVPGAVCYGAAKAETVRGIARRDRIDLARSHAYGDSYEDRFMLEAVGHPVAVNPDRKLRRLAAERGWRIVRWGR
jgi:HAD superfamily hydrolase (TIGR01490 family)